MADIISLLSLPVTSNGFKDFRSTVLDDQHATLTPPRKVARLDNDFDSGSASRSRAYPSEQVAETKGPVRLRLSGEYRE